MIRFLLCMLLLLGTNEALAIELKADAILNSITNEFINTSLVAAIPIKEAARRLFWILVPIALVLSGIKNIFKDGNFQSFFYDLISLILITGIYLFLLDNGSEIGKSIVDSMTSMTEHKKTGPSELLDLTFNTAAKLNQCISENTQGVIMSVILRILVLCFMVIMFYVVLIYTCTFICAHILCIAGVFVLGFGAISFTRHLATNYIRSILAISLELMTMLIICHSGCSILEKLIDEAESFIEDSRPLGVNECMVILFTSLFILVLSKHLPNLVGQLILGNSKRRDFSLNSLKANFRN